MRLFSWLANGGTDVHEAVLKGDLANVNLALQNGAPVDKVDKAGRTPLHAAAVASYEDFVKGPIVGTLLSHRAQTRLVDKEGHTALHLASQLGSLEVVQHLLGPRNPEAHDVKTKLLNDVDQEGCDALMLAAAAGHLALVEVLALTYGANLRRISKDGCTALLLAAEHGHRYIVASLARLGADLDARVGHTGVSALHLAARCGDLDTVEWLALGRPAMMTCYDNESKTAWQWARDAGHEHVARRIKELSAGSAPAAGGPGSYTGSDMRDGRGLEPNTPGTAGGRGSATASGYPRISDGGRHDAFCSAAPPSFSAVPPSYSTAALSQSGMAPLGRPSFGSPPSAPPPTSLYPQLPEGSNVYY